MAKIVVEDLDDFSYEHEADSFDLLTDANSDILVVKKDGDAVATYKYWAHAQVKEEA